VKSQTLILILKFYVSDNQTIDTMFRVQNLRIFLSVLSGQPRTRAGVHNLKIIRLKSGNLNQTKKEPKTPKRPADQEFRKPEVSGWFLLVIPVSTFGLGVWQVYRWRWKLELIDEMDKLTCTDTLDFSRVKLNEIESLEYKKLRVKGRFDSSKDVILGPRSLISGKGESKPQGLISQGAKTSGYLVLSPFTVSDTGDKIIVNRGWIPSRQVEKFRARSDEVEIIGIVRNTERRAPFMSKNRPESGFWMFRDLPSLAEYFNSSEIFLDLTDCNPFSSNSNEEDAQTAASLTVPVPGQTRVSLRNEHVSYFVTWFSLSGITGYMWYKMYIQKRLFR